MELGIAGLDDIEEVAADGTVASYHACRSDDGRPVTVKVLDCDDLEVIARFLREGEALVSLSRSPRIVTVLEVGTTGSGRPYVVTDVCGPSLQDRLDAGGALDGAYACSVLVGVAEAVADAHLVGVVHGGLSPAAIVAATGDYLLTDFGLGIGMGPADGYRAPELDAAPSARAPADVFALGAILCHAVTGVVPGSGAGGSTMLPPNAALANLIQAATIPDPSLRPTAADLQRALASTARTLATPDPPPGPAASSPPPLPPPSSASPPPPAIADHLPPASSASPPPPAADLSSPPAPASPSSSAAARPTSSADPPAASPSSSAAADPPPPAAASPPSAGRLPASAHAAAAPPPPAASSPAAVRGSEVPPPPSAPAPPPAPAAAASPPGAGAPPGPAVAASPPPAEAPAAAAPLAPASAPDPAPPAPPVATQGPRVAPGPPASGAAAPATPTGPLFGGPAHAAGPRVAGEPAAPDAAGGQDGARGDDEGPRADGVWRAEDGWREADGWQRDGAWEDEGDWGDDGDWGDGGAWGGDEWVDDRQRAGAPGRSDGGVPGPGDEGREIEPDWGPPADEPVAEESAGVARLAAATTELHEVMAAHADVMAEHQAAERVAEPAATQAPALDDGRPPVFARFEQHSSGGNRWASFVDETEARARSWIGVGAGIAAGLALLAGVYYIVQREAARTEEATAAAGSATSTSTFIAAIVPVVADLDEEAARARLENAGFRVVSGYEFDPVVPRGLVVSSTPPSGTAAEIGMTISLLVSRGSEPACVGSTEPGVRRQLEDRELTVAGITRSHSETIAVDLVIRCVIYDDTDTAIIVVSDGPLPVDEEEEE